MGSENHPVREVLEKVVEEKTINPDQVKDLERFVRKDWVIDEEEAKLLFRVNRALDGNEDDCAEWTDFFVTSISRFVVLDMNSPGEIDEPEGDWLADMLDEFSVDNDAEKNWFSNFKKPRLRSAVNWASGLYRSISQSRTYV